MENGKSETRKKEEEKGIVPQCLPVNFLTSI
jgi:hypothetical protein